MNPEIKNYIDEEIRKSDLRLQAESERVQKIISESRLKFYKKVFIAIAIIIALVIPAILSYLLSHQNATEFARLEEKIEKQRIETNEGLEKRGEALGQRINSAIESMSSESRKGLNELSKSEKKYPRFSATLNGKPLEAQVLDLSSSSYYANIAVINEGEGTASGIELTLYCTDSTFFDKISALGYTWERLPFVDEPLYKAEYKLMYLKKIILPPQESFPVFIGSQSELPVVQANVMLKISFERGYPKRFSFKLKYIK